MLRLHDHRVLLSRHLSSLVCRVCCGRHLRRQYCCCQYLTRLDCCLHWDFGSWPLSLPLKRGEIQLAKIALTALFWKLSWCHALAPFCAVILVYCRAFCKHNNGVVWCILYVSIPVTRKSKMLWVPTRQDKSNQMIQPFWLSIPWMDIASNEPL